MNRTEGVIGCLLGVILSFRYPDRPSAYCKLLKIYYEVSGKWEDNQNLQNSMELIQFNEETNPMIAIPQTVHLMVHWQKWKHNRTWHRE